MSKLLLSTARLQQSALTLTLFASAYAKAKAKAKAGATGSATLNGESCNRISASTNDHAKPPPSTSPSH
jgi:hypothetical protein